MRLILAGITSLWQYVKGFEQTRRLDPCTGCPHCGQSGLWLHGTYDRKADRSGHQEQSLNPIFIQRYYCQNCRKTCSALPECLPPRRWYLWEVQQTALMRTLKGKSFNAVARVLTPSRDTIRCWIARFREQFHVHKDVLCSHFMVLGQAIDFADFWHACLGNLSLAQAMRLCHVAGVPIP